MSNSAFPNAQNQAAGAIPVYTVASPSGSTALPGTFNVGQQAATNSGVALPNQAVANGGYITALTTNTGNVAVGNSAAVTLSTGYILTPGMSFTVNVNNLDLIYIVGNGTVQWSVN